MLIKILLSLLIAANIKQQFLPYRQLLLFGNDTAQSLVQQQMELLNKEALAIQERDIQIKIVEKGSPLYVKHKINPAHFEVLLIGKDGGEKYRTDTLLKPQQLFALVDAMPMRKDEMKSKYKKK